MATSGTFTGSRDGGSTVPYLTLKWERIQVDIPNNKSLIRLTLSLTSDYSINFSASKSGDIQGYSYTYTGGFRGPQTKVIKTQDIWVAHNSDGTKAEWFGATMNINITWGDAWVGTISVGGSASIDTIPRTSTFSAASLANSTLSVDTAVNLSYTVATASSSFTNSWEVWANGHHIKGWDQGGTGTYTNTLSSDDVNKIIGSTTSGSGTITVKMYTKSGSNYIGSVTRTINFTLNANIRPTASSLSVSIAGSGRDKTIGKYVQGMSKLTASFTATPGFRASITSSSINVKRQSDNGNSQTISSNSGTTSNVLSLSGTYIITATCTDSRNRTHSITTTVTVEAYSSPVIVSFSARRGSPTSTVTIARNATWNAMSGSNPATILIQSINNAGTTTTLVNNTGQTTGSHNTSSNHTGQSDASSFVYRLTVTDSFGNKAVSEVTVPTSFVEFTIRKGGGIGVGKVHERGALDIGGHTYTTGNIEFRLDTGILQARTADTTYGDIQINPYGGSVFMGRRLNIGHGFGSTTANTTGDTAISTVGKISINGEGIEIFGTSQPYIDFSLNNVGTDYDVRLSATGVNTLAVSGGNLTVNQGHIYTNNIVLGYGNTGQLAQAGALWYGNGFNGVTFYAHKESGWAAW